MFKKILCVLLCLLLILSFAACNKDEEPENNDNTDDNNQTENAPGNDGPTLITSSALEGTDIVWEIYSDHTMYLKCKGEHAAGAECALPDFEKLINDQPDQPWWEHGGETATQRATDGGVITVTKLVIGEGITSLGDYAFMDMLLLTDVTLPATLKEISFQSFYGCYRLKTVHGGFGVTLIESGAFYSCTDLQTVELSTALTEVQENAFAKVIPSGSSKKLTLKIKGTAENWAVTMATMRATQNEDDFPCLGSGNTAFENATVEYVQ